jgi:hypothetical protein
MIHFFKLTALIAIVALIIGWVLNICALVAAVGNTVVTTLFIARIFGVFVLPIGGVLGYF